MLPETGGIPVRSPLFRWARRTSLVLLLAAAPAAYAVPRNITASTEACHWLSRNALPMAPADQQILYQARRLSHQSAPIYLVPSRILAHVAHIPGAPYLTAIAGRQRQCVAVAPAWWTPLQPAERLWLVLVGVASLDHPHTYRMMVKGSGHPPSGLFSGLERWWGKRAAERTILDSEKQAASWLSASGAGTAVARSSLEKLKTVPGFIRNRWLPPFSRQIQSVSLSLPQGPGTGSGSAG